MRFRWWLCVLMLASSVGFTGCEGGGSGGASSNSNSSNAASSSGQGSATTPTETPPPAEPNLPTGGEGDKQ